MLNVFSYIATEVQPSFGGLFNPLSHDQVKTHFRDTIAKKLTYLENYIVADKVYLIGDNVTFVDAYMYVVLNWSNIVSVDLTTYPKVKKYFDHIEGLEIVLAAKEKMATQPNTIV
jgi:glutathione S-transferase